MDFGRSTTTGEGYGREFSRLRWKVKAQIVCEREGTKSTLHREQEEVVNYIFLAEPKFSILTIKMSIQEWKYILYRSRNKPIGVHMKTNCSDTYR